MNPSPRRPLHPLVWVLGIVLIGLALPYALPAGYSFGRMVLDWMGMP
jgi:hypothetical protein